MRANMLYVIMLATMLTSCNQEQNEKQKKLENLVSSSIIYIKYGIAPESNNIVATRWGTKNENQCYRFEQSKSDGSGKRIETGGFHSQTLCTSINNCKLSASFASIDKKDKLVSFEEWIIDLNKIMPSQIGIVSLRDMAQRYGFGNQSIGTLEGWLFAYNMMPTGSSLGILLPGTDNAICQPHWQGNVCHNALMLFNPDTSRVDDRSVAAIKAIFDESKCGLKTPF